MKFELRLKTKIILPLILVLLIGITILLIYNQITQAGLLADEEKRNIESTVRTAQKLLEEANTRYLAMSSIVSRLPIVQEAISKKDRPLLIDRFLPIYNHLKENFKLTQIQFHLPPATSLLRLHDINKYGDDLSSFRFTVMQTYNTQKPTIGLEVGVAGVGLRAVEPIFNRGEYVGSVEFAGGLQPEIETIKKAILAEVGVIMKKSSLVQWEGLKDVKLSIGEWIPIASTLNIDQIKALINEKSIEKAELSKGDYYLETVIGSGGQEFDLVYSPLNDFSGKKIGYLFIMRPKIYTSAKVFEIIGVNILIYLLILSIMVILIVKIMDNTIIKPVLLLTKSADEISMGKTDQKIETKGLTAEIAILAKAIERMRITMKKLLE